MPPIYISLEVTPAKELKDWGFVFHAEFSEYYDWDYGGQQQPPPQLPIPDIKNYMYLSNMEYQIERACMLLLASWYSYATVQMGTMRLRSDKKTGRRNWLPKSLPPFHAYIRAAYGSALHLIRRPPATAIQR